MKQVYILVQMDYSGDKLYKIHGVYTTHKKAKKAEKEIQTVADLNILVEPLQ
jgi:hypothetical protein